MLCIVIFIKNTYKLFFLWDRVQKHIICTDENENAVDIYINSDWGILKQIWDLRKEERNAALLVCSIQPSSDHTAAEERERERESTKKKEVCKSILIEATVAVWSL